MLGVVAILWPSGLAAETIYFKNGRRITGKVVKRNSDSVVVEVAGYPIAYALDGIERVESDPSPRASQQPAPPALGQARQPRPSVPQARGHEAGELSPGQVFQDVAPAVVVISVQLAAGGRNQSSGFLIEPDGVVVTNFHVVAGADTIEVKLKDGRAFPVIGIIAFDPDRDVCVMKIAAERLPVVSLGDSNRLMPGDRVFVIGAPVGLEYSITDGLFSGQRMSFKGPHLQFSAPVSPGNSGGPLLNAEGRVVGITTFVRPEGQNLNFAVPIEAVQALITKRSPTLMSMEQFAATISKAYFLFRQGKEAFLAGDLDRSLDLAHQAISADPSYDDAYGLAGAVYFSQGKFDEAITTSQRALQINPNQASVRSNLGGAYVHKGLLDEGIAELNKALAIDPQYADAHLNLGAAYHAKGLFDLAIAEMKKCISINPQDFQAYSNLASAYTAKGLFNEAIAAGKQAVAINPQCAAAYVNLCAAYAMQGLSDEAIVACKQALAIDPQRINAHENLGALYLDKGLLKDAVAESKTAISLNPDHARAHFNLARAYDQQGEYALAIAHADRAQELGVQAPELTQLLETPKPHRRQPKP